MNWSKIKRLGSQTSGEPPLALAIFDLDNTLLAGDSDYLWGKFLAGTGAVDGERYERENLRFYRQYQAGDLDIHEFLRFSLRPLREHSVEQLHRWRNEFLTREIDPIITLASRELIDRHRRAGDTLMIITATNSFVTAPIAERLGIDHLIATIPEIKHGRYTGEVEGIPSFREGKVKRLQIWLDEHAQDLGKAAFTAIHIMTFRYSNWSITRLRWIRTRSLPPRQSQETGRLSVCAARWLMEWLQPDNICHCSIIEPGSQQIISA